MQSGQRAACAGPPQRGATGRACQSYEVQAHLFRVGWALMHEACAVSLRGALESLLGVADGTGLPLRVGWAFDRSVDSRAASGNSRGVLAWVASCEVELAGAAFRLLLTER